MIERRPRRFSQPAVTEPVVEKVEETVAAPKRGRKKVKEDAPVEPEVEIVDNGGNNGGNGGLKKTMTALIVVVVALVGVLAYIWISKQQLVNELDAEKNELTAQMIELQGDYQELSSNYASINAQLDSSREEVNQLIARIQKTQATNRAAIRKYEKELGTLRNIMKDYIKQIDSLNTANKQLKADVASARKDLSESRKKNDELTQTVGDLSQKVAAGSIIKARGIALQGLGKDGKVAKYARNVYSFLTSLSLSQRISTRTGRLPADTSRSSYTANAGSRTFP
ncbi:MAG: hypothetical protein II276_01010 [Bacteroidales bacterium]|nr:hypothetical protein [Bacteroidales bacterium]